MVLNLTDTPIAIASIQDRRSLDYVGRILGVFRYSVQRVVDRFRVIDGNSRRVGSGRRCTSTQDYRFLTLRVLGNRDTTSDYIRNDLQEVRSVIVSERTLRRRLEEYRLTARRPTYTRPTTDQRTVHKAIAFWL